MPHADRRHEWLLPASLIVLSLVPAIAGTARLAELASGAKVTADNARFLAQPMPVVLHILSVIPYSMLGAFQFAPGFRRRHRPWHKAAGRVLGVCGLLTALTGLWMAQFYLWPAGDGFGVYLERLVFGTAMLLSIVLGLDAVRRRNFAAHGAWMIRAYAIGMGAGTQVLTHLPWFILVGKPGETARTVLMGAGWVINIVVAEWIIRRNESLPNVGLRAPGPAAGGRQPSARKARESVARIPDSQHAPSYDGKAGPISYTGKFARRAARLASELATAVPGKSFPRLLVRAPGIVHTLILCFLRGIQQKLRIFNEAPGFIGSHVMLSSLPNRQRGGNLGQNMCTVGHGVSS